MGPGRQNADSFSCLINRNGIRIKGIFRSARTEFFKRMRKNQVFFLKQRQKRDTFIKIRRYFFPHCQWKYQMLRRFAALSSMTAHSGFRCPDRGYGVFQCRLPGLLRCRQGRFPAARSKPSVNTFSYSAVLERKKGTWRAHFFQNADYFQRLLDLRGQLFQHLAVPEPAGCR